MFYDICLIVVGVYIGQTYDNIPKVEILLERLSNIIKTYKN